MKKKITAICLVVCLLAICVSGTLAYMTDTDQRTNTFTAGKVGLSLDEAKVVLDENRESDTFGDLIADGNVRIVAGDADPNYHLFPAMTVTKDPTIRIDADSENAWVGAKITVTGDVYSLLGDTYGATGFGNDAIALRRYDVPNPMDDPAYPETVGLAIGGIFNGFWNGNTTWNNLSPVEECEPGDDANDYVIYQVPDRANNTWVFYIFFKNPFVAGQTVTLFDTLKIPAAWDNAEMALINGMNIEVEAFAVQYNGFADVFTALTTAFPDHFDFD